MLTVKEAAQQLKVSPQRVRNMIYDGVLPAECYGRSWLIPDEAVRERLRSKPGVGRPRKGTIGTGRGGHGTPETGGTGGTGGSVGSVGSTPNTSASFDIAAARNLYRECRRQLYGCYDIGFLGQAQSEEERLFYTTVADFFLQQRQRELIARRVF